MFLMAKFDIKKCESHFEKLTFYEASSKSLYTENKEIYLYFSTRYIPKIDVTIFPVDGAAFAVFGAVFRL